MGVGMSRQVQRKRRRWQEWLADKLIFTLFVAILVGEGISVMLGHYLDNEDD